MTVAEREIKIEGKKSERDSLKLNIKNRRETLLVAGIIFGIISAYCIPKGILDVKKDKIVSGVLGILSGGFLLGITAAGALYTGIKNSEDKEEIVNLNNIIEDFVDAKSADFEEKIRQEREQTQKYIASFYKNFGIDIKLDEKVLSIVERREALEEQKKLLEKYELTAGKYYKDTLENLDEQINIMEENGLTRNLRINCNNQNK